MSHTHPLEGDGISAEFFKILVKQSQRNIELKFFIPDTILFYSSASMWYYYDKRTRMIKKRNAKELDKAVVYEHMVKDIIRPGGGHKHNKGVDWSHARGTGICATFTSTRHGTTSSENDVLFMGPAELKDFLFDHHSERYGFLQKFIPSKNVNNEVVQCAWSPEMVFALRRTNRLRINDRYADKYTKAVTFEGPSHYSIETLCSPSMVAGIGAACQSFVDHFHAVETRFAVSRCCLFFKSDPDENLYLLYLSSLRIMEPEWRTQTTVTSNKPMCLHIHEPPSSKLPAHTSYQCQSQFRTPSQATMKYSSREELLRLFKANRKKITKKIEDLRDQNQMQTQLLDSYHRMRGRKNNTPITAGGSSSSPLFHTDEGLSGDSWGGGRGEPHRSRSADLIRKATQMINAPKNFQTASQKLSFQNKHDALACEQTISILFESHRAAADADVTQYKTFLHPLEDIAYMISEWVQKPKRERAPTHEFELSAELNKFLIQQHPHIFHDLCAKRMLIVEENRESDFSVSRYVIESARVPPVGMCLSMCACIQRCIDMRKGDPERIIRLIQTRLVRDHHRQFSAELAHAVSQREQSKGGERKQSFRNLRTESSILWQGVASKMREGYLVDKPQCVPNEAEI